MRSFESLSPCAEEARETPRKRKKGEEGVAEPRDPQELRLEALQLLRKSYAVSQHGIQGTWGEEASFILPANAIRAWRPIEARIIRLQEAKAHSARPGLLLVVPYLPP